MQLNVSTIIDDEKHTDHPDIMNEEEYQVAFKKIREDYFTQKISQKKPHLVYVTGSNNLFLNYHK